MASQRRFVRLVGFAFGRHRRDHRGEDGAMRGGIPPVEAERDPALEQQLLVHHPQQQSPPGFRVGGGSLAPARRGLDVVLEGVPRDRMPVHDGDDVRGRSGLPRTGIHLTTGREQRADGDRGEHPGPRAAIADRPAQDLTAAAPEAPHHVIPLRREFYTTFSASFPLRDRADDFLELHDEPGRPVWT